MHAIISVINYFISKNGKHHYIVFKFYKIISKYTNENMAGVFINLFYNYRIINNIRYFIADNTELNNTCIDVIFYALYLNILIKIYKRH